MSIRLNTRCVTDQTVTDAPLPYALCPMPHFHLLRPNAKHSFYIPRNTDRIDRTFEKFDRQFPT
ncbi:hypothetical protein [Microcoleus sp. AT10_D2]|uniref:hypothetical protein n=1 Tax=Microcoleus sp. AT10_D2 TaxID=3055286 RepID=UPI002FD1E9E0